MGRTSVGPLHPGPGERCQGLISVPGLDPPWAMPTVIVRGRESGPTLAVTAGIHASEYVSIEAVTRLARWADPSTLRGTLLTILIVNTPGFFERSIYINPRDGQNLGWALPGNPEGSPSERVGAYILNELVIGSDAYVDAHCGDMIEALVPFTLWPKAPDPTVRDQSAAMARAYGLDRMLGMGMEAIPGRTYAEAARRGIPAIVGEVGQQGICDDESVRRHLRGLQNVMAHLGMIDPVGPPPAPPREMHGLAWTRTDVSATYHPCVAVGERVAKDQKTGELHDLYGETIRELLSPATGDVVFLVTCLPVKAGDPLIGIGVEAE